MAGTLRGQLGVKSSPLCPTASKLTTQYLVLDHMNNHYKKLSKAKSSIDNAPPKSIARSQKVRERDQRNTASRSGSRMSQRTDSRNTFRPYSQLDNSDIYDETKWGEPEDDEDTNVMSIMKDVLKKNSSGRVHISEEQNTTQFDNTMRWPPKDAYISQQRHTTQLTNRPVSARSMVSVGSRSTPQPMVNKTTPSGDVLEKRKHFFTEPDQPFTPRTLKSTRSSRLSEYKYYTAPKKRPETKNSRENGTDDIDGPPQENVPRPKPRNRQASANGKLDTTMDSENTLMFETLQTRDMSRTRQNKSEMVPPLDISVDKDHMNWLQEQASKAQIRAQSSRSQKSSFQGDGTLQKSGEMNRSFGLNRSWARDRVTSDEGPEYVEFVKSVTQDVLTRGIFTNRVLMQAFENHVQKNKGRLDEGKMRACLDKLRGQLGIPSDLEADMDNDNLGHSSRSPGQRSVTNPFRAQATHDNHITEKPEALVSNYPVLNQTGTTAWLSEEGGTLQSRTFGENVDCNSTVQSNHGDSEANQDMSYTATLENDGDLLMVTRALETYQMNISEQDLEESHVSRAHRGFTMANGDQDGSVKTGDSRAQSEAALSEMSDRSEKPTPRQKRRMRRQEAQELHQSDNGTSNVNQAEGRSGFGENPELAQRSEIQVDKRSIGSKDMSDYGSEKSFKSPRTESNSLIKAQTQGRPSSGMNLKDTENEQQDMNTTYEKRNGFADGAEKHSSFERNSPNQDIVKENSVHHESSENIKPMVSRSQYSHTDSSTKAEHDDGYHTNYKDLNSIPSKTTDNDEDNYDDDYADDYEEEDDVDADDEEANTLTHRTSDEDF